MTFTKLGKDENDNIVELGFDARTSHIEVVGGTRSGKTTLLKSIFLQDIIQGRGGAFFDPKGDAVEDILKHIPDDKLDRVFWLDPNNGQFPGINPLYCKDITDPIKVHATADFALDVFKQSWDIGSATPRLKTLLSMCFVTLILNKKTLADMPRLFWDKSFRGEMIAHIPDTKDYEHVLGYWREYFNRLRQPVQEERSESTLDKVLDFLINPIVKKIVDHPTTQLDFVQAMKNKHVFLIRLSPWIKDEEGGVGEEGRRLIGMLVLSLILRAARMRPKDERYFFSLVIDEVQEFSSPQISRMFEQIGEFGVGATFAFQHRDQLDTRLKGAVAQTGTKVVFRLSPKDTHEFDAMFAPDAPTAEIRREEKLICVRNLSGRVLANEIGEAFTDKRHPNDIVNEFIKNWVGVRKEIAPSLVRDKYKYEYWSLISCKNQYCCNLSSDEDNTYIDGLNRLFYEVMQKRNPYTLLPVTVLELMIRPISLPFFDSRRYGDWALAYEGKDTYYPFYDKFSRRKELFTLHPLAYKRTKHPAAIEYGEDGSPEHSGYAPRDFVWCLLKEGIYGEEPVANDVKEAYRLLWEARDETVLSLAFAQYEQVIRATLREQMQKELDAQLGTWQIAKLYSPYGSNHYYWVFNFIRTVGLLWLLPYEKLDTEKSSHYVTPIYDCYTLSDVEWQSIVELFKGTGREPIVQARLQAEIDKIIAKQKPHFEAFVREVREVLQILAKEPIEERSGIFEEKPRLRENPQYTITDMEKELISLEPGIAWCRIVEKIDKDTWKNRKVKIKLLKLAKGIEEKEYIQRFNFILKKTFAIYGRKEPPKGAPVKPILPPLEPPKKVEEKTDLEVLKEEFGRAVLEIKVELPPIPEPEPEKKKEEKKVPLIDLEVDLSSPLKLVAEEKAGQEGKEEQTELPKPSRARGAKHCPNCSQQNALNAKFCHQCGMQFER